MFAQSIVPGMLHKLEEYENAITYGTLDSGKTFSMNKKFNNKVHNLHVQCGEMNKACLYS